MPQKIYNYLCKSGKKNLQTFTPHFRIAKVKMSFTVNIISLSEEEIRGLCLRVLLFYKTDKQAAAVVIIRRRIISLYFSFYQFQQKLNPLI